MTARVPPPLPGTSLRLLGTSDLGATTLPLRTSYGSGGSAAGVVELLERSPVPAIWLEAGDLVVGSPAYALLGARPWDEVADLPISAAAAGNHDFDDGVDALLTAAGRLSFPLLCSNVDVGLPGSVVVETAAGVVGVIGVTHPAVDRFTPAPAVVADWRERVVAAAWDLRRSGARWVVVLLHDGVEWWPSGSGIATRSSRLSEVARPWAASADLVLAGHNFGAWTGSLAGTPAAEPHLFAASVAVVDMVGGDAVVRGVFPVPPVCPESSSAAVSAVSAAASRVVGSLPVQWLTRTGAPHYLPDFVAQAWRQAVGADAGFALPNFHGIQAPFDGAIAALGPGAVSEADVLRMCAAPDYDPVVALLAPGELRRCADAFWAVADPRNEAGDRLWWNWCRMPAGLSGPVDSAESVAVIPGVVPHLCEWLDRDVETSPGGVAARDALVAALG